MGHHRWTPPKKPLPPTYKERLLKQLDAIESDYVAALEASGTQYVDPGIVTAADWERAPSGPALEMQRMDLLRRLRDWKSEECREARQARRSLTDLRPVVHSRHV